MSIVQSWTPNGMNNSGFFFKTNIFFNSFFFTDPPFFSNLSLFKDENSVVIYVPEDDFTLECKIDGDKVNGKGHRNDEYFKGEIEIAGVVLADNFICGSISGKHKEVPDLEISGSFSIYTQ